MTTRGQTQTRPPIGATSTGPQTQVQAGPVQGQAAVTLPPGTVPSAAAAPIWNQISFMGQNWTNEKLTLFLGHVESYLSKGKDRPLEAKIDSNARGKQEQCLLVQMKKYNRSFPDGEQHACFHCFTAGPCIRVKWVVDSPGDFDPQHSGKRWLMEVRPKAQFEA
ncbi:MAG: hypothetical protein Q9180_004778, partial [Flavoplaca navasiana]